MTATSSWPRATLRRPGYPNPGIRVSDAERADIADRLARHYGEGRLDMTEFDERVTRAMAAKTYGDFQGLFSDLPDLPGEIPSDTAGDHPAGDPLGATSAPGMPPLAACNGRLRHRRGPVRTAVAVALFIVAANIAWHAVTGWIWPVMWLIILAAIVVAVSKNGHRHGN